MNLILIGPPGCGKGTQAERIVDKYNFTYISTGNLIREEIAEGTELGKRVHDTIEQGKLVEDHTIIELVKKTIQGKNAILFDGFPRTLDQAHAIDKLRPVDCVIDIQVSDDEVINRIGRRWMVERNHEQHTFMSEADAKADAVKNGGEAFQREDDKPDVIKQRLKTYHSQTEPIIEYYGKKHKLFIVNGEKSPDNVWKDIQSIIDKKIAKK